MLKELARDATRMEDMEVDFSFRLKKTIEFIGELKGKVLDVGPQNLLRDKLQDHYKIKIDGTEGDLDDTVAISDRDYDHIILSHVIEHVFNPLHLFQSLVAVSKQNTYLHVFTPHRRYIFLDLSTKGHFHEFTDYEMELLAKRAGLTIVERRVHKHWKSFTRSVNGVRPLLRLLFDFYVYYRMKPNLEEKSKIKSVGQ